MIDCLSNPSWINPQIDFLLFLQNIRIGHFEFLDKFFLSITTFGEFFLPTLVAAIVYWCVDSKVGIYLFSISGFNALITHFFKMIACVYRPWVLSDKIQPSKVALFYTKGYSFPSGHSAISSSFWGAVAYLLRRKKAVCIFFICLILLVGFSRLWLGVHTPQDVICGFLIGVGTIFATGKIIGWAEKSPNRYLYLLILVNVIAALMTVYICFFNKYRIDYISGELLVNPEKAINSTLSIYAYFMGILNGCFVCRKYFPFNPKDTTLKNRVVIGIIGGLFVFFVMRPLVLHFLVNVSHLKVALPSLFGTGLFITLIYPLIFRCFDKNLRDSV